MFPKIRATSTLLSKRMIESPLEKNLREMTHNDFDKEEIEVGHYKERIRCDKTNTFTDLTLISQ